MKPGREPLNKPFHKPECRCDQCVDWLIEEIRRLRIELEKAKPAKWSAFATVFENVETRKW